MAGRNDIINMADLCFSIDAAALSRILDSTGVAVVLQVFLQYTSHSLLSGLSIHLLISGLESLSTSWKVKAIVKL